MDLITLLDAALQNLRKGPKGLANLLEFTAIQNEAGSGAEFMNELRHQLGSADPNDQAVACLGRWIRDWDHQEAPAWAGTTAPHTPERRQLICQRLELSAADAALVERAIPPFERSDRATVIAESHEPWYEAGRSTRKNFYWDAYERQLSAPGSGWTPAAIGVLAGTTEDIVSRLSDPTRKEIYPVKGLVVGYVQSGKTAHFTGVIAKAIDAGYRLIIVLAGTLNLLRRQTQRRIDKELIGQEQLSAEEYLGDTGWNQFVSHGDLPSHLGSVDVERLTGLEEDYSRLGARLAALKFRKTDPSRPFNAPENLDRAPVRLVVIKKMPKMVQALTHDLAELGKQGARLDEIPTLVIDDESDQASVNTIKPNWNGREDDRTATNGAIVDLLKALPRSQYVGYTATPFANVFINPDEADQLFPKDFIVSLPRPSGYMGVRDFFDFDAESGEKGPNERRHVRFIQGEDSLVANLPRAIDLFLLSGAMKLFRTAARPELRYKHHTMLIHHAAQTDVHEQVRQEVQAYFDRASNISPARLDELGRLYASDIVPHLDGGLPSPASFDELRPFMARCVAEMNKGKAVRIVNGDERNADDTPDFDSGPVWALLIGGTKLSRGYTVEGLTVSYYRRRAGAGDTLMQMGRWFGFRQGYVDLVRWFVGTEEPIGKTGRMANLYLQFRALCRDEDAFREELTRYADNADIRPIQVPPLVHSHLPSLPPSSKNKMYNAVLKFKNLGAKWLEKVAVSAKERQANINAAGQLLQRLDKSMVDLTVRLKGRRQSFRAVAAQANAADVLSFLESFRWANGARSFQLELEYLKGAHGDPGIRRWLVVLPQVDGESIGWPAAGLATQTSVAGRAFDDEAGFSVFSEPRHRAVAEYLCGVASEADGADASADLIALADKETAVLMLYLVRPMGHNAEWANITLGFGMQLPKSRISQQVMWTVSNKGNRDAVVVPAAVTAA